MIDKYPNMSPYNYCAWNPVKLVDLDGKESSPIYDSQGDFLGTDDKGLQGKAIVMRKENFKQSMHHEDALRYNLGEKGFKDNGARKKFANHYAELKNRPDYDGVLTKEEADLWYCKGTGDALFVDCSKIQLPGISANHLFDNEIGKSLYHNFQFNVEPSISFDSKGESLITLDISQTGQVYGTLKLTYLGNNKVALGNIQTSKIDDYDFNMDGRPIRDLATKMGCPGPGRSYKIYGYGYAVIR